MQPFLAISDIVSMTGYEFESACRRNVNYAYMGGDVALCRILTKYKLYVDLKDTAITPHLIMDGFWETWLTMCLARIIKQGDVCIDVGANVGYYSILMSSLSGDNGQTIAIEPHPYICKLLRSTANIHNNHIKVVEMAASKNIGSIQLYLPHSNLGGASIIYNSLNKSLFTKRKKVKTTSIDALVSQLELRKVDVIKIDVEGAEPQVFEGMKKTIESNPDLKIIIEYSPFLYSDARQFTEYLFSQFKVHRLKDVDEMTVLEEDSISELLKLNDHTDLYLERKE